MPSFHDVFPRDRHTLIGVIHLRPLPGYTSSPGISAIVDAALADLAAMAHAVDGVLVENEHDHPHRVESAPETTAAMAVVARELVRAAGALPVGVEILLNDPYASLAAALAAGARFIRTDYFVDRMERDGFGEMTIDPPALLAYRRRIGAAQVLILADLQVKYARMIEPRPLAASAEDAAGRRADALVVTGTATGTAPTPGELDEARAGARDLPVLVGSGLTPENAEALLASAAGAIVGTALQSDGVVDRARVDAVAAAVRRAQRPPRP
jgi:hypothetical protein